MHQRDLGQFVQAIFTMNGKPPTGKVTIFEFGNYLNRIDYQGSADSLALLADKDHDNMLSFNELMFLFQRNPELVDFTKKKNQKLGTPDRQSIGLKSKQIEELDKQVKYVFDMFDRDGDGSIDVSELREYLRMHGNRSNSNMIFNMLDRDHSGKISKEELFHFLAKNI